jgi:hypothetical protein
MIKSAALCKTNEFRRGHKPQLRMLPTEKRFQARNFPGLTIDLGLVNEKQFAPGQGHLQTVCQRQLLHDLDIHLFCEDAYPVRPILFCGVEGDVRILKQSVPIGSMIGKMLMPRLNETFKE